MDENPASAARSTFADQLDIFNRKSIINSIDLKIEILRLETLRYKTVYNTTTSEATEKMYKRLETGRQPWREKGPQQYMALPRWAQERLLASQGF
jgi:hypothetical protein